MRSNATLFAVSWLLMSVALLMVSINFYFNTVGADAKIALFLVVASGLFIGLGIFFLAYQDKLNLYLRNYHTDKNEI